MEDDNPSLRVLETARCWLEWEARWEDTWLKTMVNMRFSSGYCGQTCWKAREMDLRSRECLILVQTYSPGSLTFLFPVPFNFGKKRAAIRAIVSPGNEETRAPDTRKGKGYQRTRFHSRIKPRAYKTRHCVLWGQKIQSLLDPLTQAASSSLPLTHYSHWEEAQAEGPRVKNEMTPPLSLVS